MNKTSRRGSAALWLAILGAAFGAAGAGPCENRDLGGDVASPADASPSDAATRPDGSTGVACGPGLPCPGGQHCEITPSCIAPDLRRGVCVAGDQGCGAAFIQLCGCDRQTYQSCELPQAGVFIDHDGPCTPDPHPTACDKDDDCTGTGFTKPVRSTADCYCRGGCGDAQSKKAAAANQAGWERHCSQWEKSQRCIVPPCVPPPPIVCRAQRCTYVDDCRGALEKKQQGATPAACAPLARCTQIAQQPQRRVSFRLVLNKTNNGMSISAEDRQRNATCVADLLRDRGAQVAPYDGLGDVQVVGTYGQIQDALALEIVRELEPGCESTEVCRECAPLAAAACAADAFCQTVVGQPIDTTRGCIGKATPIGCDPAGRSCPPVIVYAADPQGTCFQINSGCAPPTFQPRAGCQAPVGGEYPPCP